MYKRIIAFEGTEGCGKTTAIELTKQTLAEKGYVVQVLGAIKDGPIAAIARERFLKQDMNDFTAAVTKMAGIIDVIYQAKRWLSENPKNFVLLDRSVYSFAVYDKYFFKNHVASYLLREAVWNKRTDIVTGGAFLIQSDIQTCIHRLASRTVDKSFMDEKPYEDHFAILKYYQIEFTTRHYSSKASTISNDSTLETLNAILHFEVDKYLTSMNLPLEV